MFFSCLPAHFRGLLAGSNHGLALFLVQQAFASSVGSIFVNRNVFLWPQLRESLNPKLGYRGFGSAANF